MPDDSRTTDWQKLYAEKDTPWDKGKAAPPLTAFLHRKKISGRVLVPGCGRGHDVLALGARPDIAAVGLDLSSIAIAEARELAATASTAGQVSFIEGDFLHLPTKLEQSFDWLVEHTCFCAIEPRQRMDYVLSSAAALRKGGKFFGIFFINPETEMGPPFTVSREELSDLFGPYFVVLEQEAPGESFPERQNREWVMVMQKR